MTRPTAAWRRCSPCCWSAAACAERVRRRPTAQALDLHHHDDLDRPEHHGPLPVEPLAADRTIAPRSSSRRRRSPTPAPLVVLLHGYGSNAAQQDAYLGVTEQAATRGLYVLLPDGTKDGARFWDAVRRAATSPARPSTTSPTSAT